MQKDDRIFRPESLNTRAGHQLRILYEEGDVSAVHRYYERAFSDFYRDHGYHEVHPLPLLTEQDRSVVFTGASISALKPVLRDGSYPEQMPGYYVAQPCLRVHAYKYLFDNDWIPYGQSYFSMATNLSRPGRFHEVLDEAMRFTIDHMGVSRHRIKILTSKSYHYLDDIQTEEDVSVDYDTRDPGYYTWEYGMDDVWGEGVTIAVYNESTKKWMEVGNVVVIYDEDGEEMGVEFGYGYEYFLTAALSVENPLKLSRAFDLFEFTDVGLRNKYYSYIEIAMQMKLAGAQVGNKGPDHIYKQHLKALQYMAESLPEGRSVEGVLEDMKDYLGFIGVRDPDLISEAALLMQHVQRKANYNDLIKRVGKYLWCKNNDRDQKEVFLDPVKTIVQYLQQNGIDPAEVEEATERLLRFDLYDDLMQKLYPDK